MSNRTDKNQNNKNDELIEELLKAAGPREQAPEIVQTRVRQAVYAEWLQVVKQRKQRRQFFVGSALAASIIAAAIGIGVFLQSNLGPLAKFEVVGNDIRVDGLPVQVGAELQRGSKITSMQSRAALKLANGESLRLDIGTEIVLAGQERIQLISGAVYVDTGTVGRNDKHITIETPFGEATDIGTQFEVRTLSDSLQVSVREGLVELAAGNKPIHVNAGAQVNVDHDGETSRIPLPATAEDWNWTQLVAPSYDIEGETLASFLQWVSRETGLQVQTASVDAARSPSRVILHGSIDGLTPMESIALVFVTTDLDYEIDNGVLTIRTAD